MGACEFLALLSGLIDCLMVLPLSIILSRTDFKAAKTADQWEAELDEWILGFYSVMRFNFLNNKHIKSEIADEIVDYV